MKRMVMSLLMVVATALPVHAQWAQTSGPEGGSVQSMAASGVTTLVTGWGGTLYRYNGNWTRIDGFNPQRLFFVTGRFLASNADGLYISSNQGTSWQPTGLEDGPFSVVRMGAKLFVANMKSLFVSTGFGTTWDSLGSVDSTVTILNLIGRGTHLYMTIVGSEGCELLRSADEGETWEKIGGDLDSGEVINSVEAFDNTIVVAFSKHGVFRSTDAGETWQEINDGLAVSEEGPAVTQLLYNGWLWAACDDGVYRYEEERWVKKHNEGGAILTTVGGGQQGEVLMGTNSGVYSGGDNGDVWESLNQGLKMQYINDMATAGNAVLAATPSGLFRTDDTGDTWESIADFGVRQVLEHSGALFALPTYPYTHVLARSTNGGRTWQDQSLDITGGMEPIGVIAATEATLYVSVGASTLWSNFPEGRGGLFRSTDNGETWEDASQGLPRFDDTTMVPVSALFAEGNAAVAAAMDTVYYSEDRGTTWHASNMELPTFYLPVTMVAAGGRIYLANDVWVFSSSDNGATWTEEPVAVPQSGLITDMVVVDGAVVVLAESNALNPDESVHKAFMMRDGSWRDISDRFTARIGHQTLHQLGAVLLSGTRAQSIWRASTASIVGAHAAVEDRSSNAFGHRAAPNPFTEDFAVNFTLESYGRVRLAIVNGLGQEVKMAFDGYVEPGEHTVVIDAADLPAGVWYYHLTVDDRSTTGKVLKNE